jgi:hypothetical protein
MDEFKAGFGKPLPPSDPQGGEQNDPSQDEQEKR